MNKEQYLNYLKSGNFDIHIFYDYYKEHNKKEEYNFSIEDFNICFNQFASLRGVNNAIATVKQYYDIKFGIIEVKNKKGIIIGRY